VPEGLRRSVRRCPAGEGRITQCSGAIPGSDRRMPAEAARPIDTSRSPSGKRVPRSAPLTIVNSASIFDCTPVYQAQTELVNRTVRGDEPRGSPELFRVGG